MGDVAVDASLPVRLSRMNALDYLRKAPRIEEVRILALDGSLAFVPPDGEGWSRTLAASRARNLPALRLFRTLQVLEGASNRLGVLERKGTSLLQRVGGKKKGR